MMKVIKDSIRLLGLFVQYTLAWVALHCGYKKILKRDTWLLSEKHTEARDNGYHMYRYLRGSKVKDDVYYSIETRAEDYHKVACLGNIVEYNSFFHVALYLGSKYLLSANYDAKPHESVRGIHKLNVFRRKDQIRVNLSHGIIKDDIPQAFDYKIANYHLLICGAIPSFNYLKQKYDYPDKNIALSGLCRFDALTDTSTEKIVLVMPTFREWLRTSDSSKEEASPDEIDLMRESLFYHKYTSLLMNNNLVKTLSINNAKLLFYLHYTIQPYVKLFKQTIESEDIIICDREHYDVQDLLKKASVLVTDYSSVAFDFAYMGKPLSYYHFDYEQYRGNHYKEGWFNYERDGLGPVINSEEEIVKWIGDVLPLEPGCWNYLGRCDNFFAYRDEKNCERVYQAVQNLAKQ